MLLLMVACGGREKTATTADAFSVERAFRDHGIVLHRLPTSGAEQPAMGFTSACATRYSAAAAKGTVVVAICDDANAAKSIGGSPAFRRSRGNVVADYSGDDERTRQSIASALEALD